MNEQIEKQAIEEMSKVIEITEQIARDAHCGLPSPTMYAKDLYWHGYRKQSEVERLQAEIERLTINMNAYGLTAKRLAEEKTEIFAKIEDEIVAAIKSNVKAIDERQEKINAYEDSFIVRCYGKIDALRGIDGFVEELKKKYTEGESNG